MLLVEMSLLLRTVAEIGPCRVEPSPREAVVVQRDRGQRRRGSASFIASARSAGIAPSLTSRTMTSRRASGGRSCVAAASTARGRSRHMFARMRASARGAAAARTFVAMPVWSERAANAKAAASSFRTGPAQTLAIAPPAVDNLLIVRECMPPDSVNGASPIAHQRSAQPRPVPPVFGSGNDGGLSLAGENSDEAHAQSVAAPPRRVDHPTHTPRRAR